MYTANLKNEYIDLLFEFKKTNKFGHVPITHILNSSEPEVQNIKQFYKTNALILKNKPVANGYIDLNNLNPSVCGGVTEFLTKIRLARKYNVDFSKIIDSTMFDFNDIYLYIQDLSDEEIAFELYQYDVIYRCGMGYSDDVLNTKKQIISKAAELSNKALDLIARTFPKIDSIDIHPDGKAILNGKMAIKGDCDLMINNCLIDFKTKKDVNIQLNDRAQLFAYAINKYLRDSIEYDKVYVLNARNNYICELFSKN